ncbi:MAG TPA: MEDS domain-containing protein, partial [Armatimonadota bacterium]|nr:MEDS domain-containing protein [Armatimonadota bacterium]
MSADCCESGIEALGPLPWGTHFCQFYKTREDLLSTLVPYFQAGLQDHEACLWVTSEPLVAAQAKMAMAEVMPDFHRHLESGQIEIIDFEDWYVALGDVDADQVLAAWVERQQRALNQGYNGLRLTGNTFWLERSGWNDFMDYERKVNENFWKFRILGLCTYSLDQCGGDEVIDVVANHQFALALRRGRWEVVENASLKIAKGELARLNGELEQRVAARTAELEASLRGRETYMATLAHELRNPLGAISNAVTVLEQAEPQSPPYRRALEVARRQIQHQNRMVDDLLSVSRINHGTFELQREWLDLTALCRQAVEDFRPQIEAAGLDLSLHLPARDLYTDADGVRLNQVLSNLLENTRKFTPAGGRVVVRLEAAGDDRTALLTVADTRTGITRELLPHVFDLFTQAEQSLDRRAGGLGLGLALVRGIVELHGGTAKADSEGPGRGARFTVTLPLSETPPSQGSPATMALDTPAALRVLVIDDNPDAAETLADL